MASQNPSGRLWLGTAIIFAVVIPLALWLGIAAQVRAVALERATADQQYVVEAVGEHTLKLLDTQALLLDWIDQVASERDCQALRSDDRLQAFMSLAARKSPIAISLWILNAGGHECMGSDPAQMDDHDLSFREYFGGARTVGPDQYYVDRAIVGLSSAIPVFNVAKPRTKHGRFNGVILASVSLASLIDYWGKTLDIVHEQRVSLLRQDGATIARSWPPLVPSSDPAIERRVAAALTAPEGTNRGHSAVDGRPRLGAWRTLPGWNVVVSSSVNEDDVMAPWRQSTLINGVVAILTSALMGILTWSVLTGRQRLVNTVKERTVELTSIVKELREAHALAGSREGQARESEERFRRLVEAMPSAMVKIDTAGRIVMVNAQTERLFGYTRSELIGAPVEMLLPADARAKHPGLRSGFFANPTSRPMGEGRALFGLKKDGSQVEVEIGLSPIETDEGLMVLSAIVDISSRVRLEAQVRQSQKMHAIGRVVAGVAHDFNNMLQAQSGALEMLLDAVADRPRV
jgi:PAS domain S-box-containing protein